jgi:hypothetical protein
MKTRQEVQQDIQSAITGDTFHELIIKGYSIRYTWIKTNAVGAIIRVNRKNLYRVQITEAELCGSYYKSWIAEIPSDVQYKYNRHVVNINKVC